MVKLTCQKKNSKFTNISGKILIFGKITIISGKNLVFAHLFVNVHRPGDSDVAFVIFDSSYHLLKPVEPLKAEASR